MKKNNNNNTFNLNSINHPTDNLDSHFNQTLKTFHGSLKGRSFPGKVLLTRHTETFDTSSIYGSPREYPRSPSENVGQTEPGERSGKVKIQSTDDAICDGAISKSKSSVSTSGTSNDSHKGVINERATDSARIMKFKKELSAPTAILEKLRELAWSGVPSYMRPNVWRLLLGYAPPNSDRRERILMRKRLEYHDCVAQYYDIPDSERPEDEINMLRQGNSLSGKWICSRDK